MRAGWILIAGLCLASYSQDAEEFWFIHASDVHVPVRASADTVRRIRETCGEKSKPAFVIVTGDLTEFGGSGDWQKYVDLWKDFEVPVYHVLGNHDATWHSLNYQFRRKYGAPYYAFEAKGCKFICLESSTVQDPRPSFGVEELEWLKGELAKTRPTTPLFLAFHHPLTTDEFASPYDWERVLELVADHNVALFLVGHHHTASQYTLAGYPAVIGGSTFGNQAGYSKVRVGRGRVFVEYVFNDGHTKILYDGPFAGKRPKLSLEVSVTGTQALATVRGEITTDTLDIEVRGRPPVKAKRGGDGSYTATFSMADAAPGRYVARVQTPSRVVSREFEVVGGRKPVWTAQLKGSSKCAPLVADGKVWVGTNEGRITCLDDKDGRVLWSVDCSGEVTGRLLRVASKVIAGAGDGHVRAIDDTGKVVWQTPVGGPVYGGCVGDESGIFVATLDGTVSKLSVDGKVEWTRKVATYAIEAAGAVTDSLVIFGAWDTFVYAVTRSDGQTAWKAPAKGSLMQKAARYYSAADAPPVVFGDRVFATDRDYRLSIFDLKGEMVGTMEDAVAACTDGSSVFVRRGAGLAKLDGSGNVVWSIACEAGRIPAAPAAGAGRVVLVSSTGLLQVFDEKGQLRWSYQVTPGLYVMSPPTIAGGRVYVSDMAGRVTCLPLD